MEIWGNKLSEILMNATRDVVIVAPYIKNYALQRLVSNMSEKLTSVTCVTRWLPEDIASGVCDLDIFSTLNGTQGGRLLVQSNLHGKYYRGDDRCLIGSANLTKPRDGMDNARECRTVGRTTIKLSRASSMGRDPFNLRCRGY